VSEEQVLACACSPDPPAAVHACDAWKVISHAPASVFQHTLLQGKWAHGLIEGSEQLIEDEAQDMILSLAALASSTWKQLCRSLESVTAAHLPERLMPGRVYTAGKMLASAHHSYRLFKGSVTEKFIWNWETKALRLTSLPLSWLKLKM
jgi:hypothetical protein